MHDLGGKDGFGPVVVEEEEPVFHEDWEGRVFAMAGLARATCGFGTPQFRHAIERMRPAAYLAASYYERWLTALATLVVEKQVVSAADLDQEVGGTFALSGPVRAAPLGAAGPDLTEPRFSVGDAVRVRVAHPRGHTRCPGYVRGRRGVVVRYDGPCNFDDVEAHAEGKRVEPLYCVRFQGADLFGQDSEPNSVVYADLFDSYLEAR